MRSTCIFSRLNYLFIVIIAILQIKHSHAWFSDRISCRLSFVPFNVTYNNSTQNFERYQQYSHENLNTTQVYKALHCSCAGDSSDQYCLLLNDENTCSVPRYRSASSRNNLHCYHSTSMDTFIRIFYTPLFFVVMIAVFSLFTTRCGVMTRNYLLNKCFPCTNRRKIFSKGKFDRYAHYSFTKLLTNNFELTLFL